MISNCFRQLVFNTLVICAIGVSLVKADDAAQKLDTDCVSATAVIVDQSDDGFVVELTITGKSQQGVPLLRNVPYVSRLFKNTGVAKVTKTIFVPNGVLPAIVEFDTVQELATTDSVDDAVELIPIDWDNELIQCDFAVPASKHKAKAKSRNGKCKGASCDCKKAKETSVKKLQKQLFAIAVENAELRARAETQKEIAQLKEKLLQVSTEAKLQTARFQAHTAFTNFARSRQQQHTPQHVQLHAQQYDQKHHNPIVEQLKQENTALRKLVAELELKERGQSKR